MGKYAVFISKVDANADVDALLAALRITTAEADRMESELTGGKDKY